MVLHSIVVQMTDQDRWEVLGRVAESQGGYVTTAQAEEAGFFPVDLELHAEVGPPKPVKWEIFANSSGNPKIPTYAEAMEQALTPEERERVTAHLRPLVEEGRGVRRMAHAYLRATKP